MGSILTVEQEPAARRHLLANDKHQKVQAWVDRLRLTGMEKEQRLSEGGIARLVRLRGRRWVRSSRGVLAL
jgi:hypothetical protein